MTELFQFCKMYLITGDITFLAPHAVLEKDETPATTAEVLERVNVQELLQAYSERLLAALVAKK